MSMRNYHEVDLAFYSSEVIEDIEVKEAEYGYRIEWEPIEGVGGYAIYRGNSDTGWELLQTVDEDVTEYYDIQPPQQEVFFYRVEAIIEGDLITGEPNEEGLVDLALVEKDQCARQDMTNRIRTQTGDWRSHPELGADLELLEGEPNTRETGYRGAEQILNALTYDGRFNEEDLMIRPVPVSINRIDYYVVLDSDETQPIVVTESLEL
ncbi:hypothetical protein [Parageobacillus galactosidasius]|uniref:hypothetical protein n=1 Tax=Parageobacillus galactosidasius TaxID=883812 RepID=UPI001FEA68DB|nr:hypothetical protein [Parageobacillus galactosidasius]